MINIKDGKKQPVREHLVMYGLIWTNAVTWRPYDKSWDIDMMDTNQD